MQQTCFLLVKCSTSDSLKACWRWKCWAGGLITTIPTISPEAHRTQKTSSGCWDSLQGLVCDRQANKIPLIYADFIGLNYYVCFDLFQIICMF